MVHGHVTLEGMDMTNGIRDTITAAGTASTAQELLQAIDPILRLTNKEQDTLVFVTRTIAFADNLVTEEERGKIVTLVRSWDSQPAGVRLALFLWSLRTIFHSVCAHVFEDELAPRSPNIDRDDQ